MKPLAEQLRPQSLDQYLGQEHLVGQNGALRKSLEVGRLPSIVLWGPPGVGKTTLALLLAKELEAPLYQLSAVSAGVKDVREILATAEKKNLFDNKRPILFIDEIHRFNKGQQYSLLHAVERATPLENDSIKERPLYYEPFVGLIPENHRLFKNKTITAEELEMGDILLLEDGNCFKDSVLNLCTAHKIDNKKGFQLESGSFDTLIKLSKEGLGMTLLPYLHTLDLNDIDKSHLREFTNPPPAREVSLIYHKSQLKMQLIEALKKTIDGVILGAISFSDVKIISPLQKK